MTDDVDQRAPYDRTKAKEGDTVFIFAGKHVDSFIAKIVSISHKDGIAKLLWYYKPEDVIGGRQSWHGEKELFAQPITGLTNKNPIDSIEGACRVHTLDEYERLEEIGENDYFWRFEYNPLKKGTFKPDQVPVYCVCELPYNPDKPMIECAICKEWFHWECVGYFREAHAEGLEPNVCKECEHQKKDEDGDETQ